jgi:hypothetical protein
MLRDPGSTPQHAARTEWEINRTIDHSNRLYGFSVDDQIKDAHIELFGGHVEIALAIYLHLLAAGRNHLVSNHHSGRRNHFVRREPALGLRQ